jgi:small subunit ribosomal protein S20
MPHVPVHPSAIKRHRQNLKRRLRNRTVKAQVHTAIKRVTEAIESGAAVTDPAPLRNAIKELGKAASKGVMHRNTVSRKIARLSRQAAKVAAAPAAS